MVFCRSLAVNNHTHKARPKSIGLNGILQFCNFVVACLIFSGFFQEKLTNHLYVNWLTLVLGLALCLQTHIALRLEKRNPDPFVLIMAYLLVFFYSLRIFTLLLYPVQVVFLRYTYTPADTNYALLFILTANVFIYAGFYRVKFGSAAEINTVGYKPTKPRFGVLLFVVSVLFGLFVQKNIAESIAPFINLIYNNFLTPNIILLVLAAYIIPFHKRLPPIYIKFLLGGAAIILVLQTLSFSRSGLLTFVDTLLVVVLALLPTIRLPRKLVFTGFALLPFLMATAFTFYSISTVSRMVKGDSSVTVAEKVELFQVSLDKIRNDPRTDFFIGQALSRAGYFDYSAELIAHSDRYAGLFTVVNYLKSIVDNVFTPGFDVFDQPRISNSLRYVGSSSGAGSKIEEIVENYHSDQFGLYGEMYNLFGYASLIILYLMSYLLKKAFLYKGRFNICMIALSRILVLSVFFQLMNSFGLDWILANILISSASFYCLSKIFQIRLHGRIIQPFDVVRIRES